MEASDSSLILQARPAPRAGHFDVHPSDRPLTVPEEPVFSLETRSARSAARQQFDAAMAAKQQLLEVIWHCHPSPGDGLGVAGPLPLTSEVYAPTETDPRHALVSGFLSSCLPWSCAPNQHKSFSHSQQLRTPSIREICLGISIT